jgi:RNA polymerase sigma-70 factor, ECF subfamily
MIEAHKRQAVFLLHQEGMSAREIAAVAMCGHPEKGLALIDALLARGELANYHLAHSARAELCRRRGRLAEASASYEKALALVWQESDRRFLAARLQELK